MIKQAYINGFLRKCAQYGVDPLFGYPPSQKVSPFIPWFLLNKYHNRTNGTNGTFQVSLNDLEKSLKGILQKNQRSQKRQPLLITR